MVLWAWSSKVLVTGICGSASTAYKPTFLSWNQRRTRSALAGLEQTAPAFEEAAENLGASRWRVIRLIVLPLIAANIVAGSILTFSFAVLEVSDSIMLAQRENFFPITKAIYVLLARPDDGPYIASAMGVLGMLLLTTALIVASAILGRRMGELFRA